MFGSVCRRHVAPRLLVTLSPPPRQASRFNAVSRFLSTQEASRFAVVDHSEAYENAMSGRHGKQLNLAQIDAIGKDDPPFDPFIEEELMEEEEYDEGEQEEEEDENLEEDTDEKVTASEEEESENEEGGVLEEPLEALDDDAEEEISPYTSDGSLRWKKSQIAAFRAGAPAGGLFAVIRLAGSQHKVTTDDVLIVNKVKPIDTYAIGSVHTLNDVLLISSSHLTLVGMPLVEGAEVDVMVEEITQDQKVIIFKNRRRKNSKTKKGFRRDVTMLRVLDIRMPDTYQNHTHKERESVGEEAN